jgi:hypothetical protein
LKHRRQIQELIDSSLSVVGCGALWSQYRSNPLSSKLRSTLFVMECSLLSFAVASSPFGLERSLRPRAGPYLSGVSVTRVVHPSLNYRQYSLPTRELHMAQRHEIRNQKPKETLKTEASPLLSFNVGRSGENSRRSPERISYPKGRKGVEGCSNHVHIA